MDDPGVSRRRPTGLLLAAVVAAIALGGAASRLNGDDTSALAELERRVSSREASAPFAFEYARGGTRVQECFTPNLRFFGEVDPGDGRVVLRLDTPDGEAVVVNDGRTAWLHRSLFRDPPFTQSWLAVRLPVAGAERESLQGALGADLAADALAAQRTASGHELVSAAVEVADEVERIDPIVVGGERLRGYRITVNPEEFQAAADADGRRTTTTSQQAEAVPTIEVWIDRADQVVRVAVRSQRANGSPGPAEDSWTVDYRSVDEVPVSVPDPGGDVVDAAAIDLSRLAPAQRECRLPI